MTKAYTIERRYVLGVLAAFLEHALSNGYGWIREPPFPHGLDAAVDESTERRRIVAIRSLMTKFRKEASK